MTPSGSHVSCAAGAGRRRRARALAQDNYPNRPIRVIASQGAGGLSDTWMRAVADELGPLLGGSVVVEDRPGAAGNDRRARLRRVRRPTAIRSASFRARPSPSIRT